jgi:hypothetical protein
LFADFGALGADVRRVLRAAQHEVGADRADLRAVEHQLEVVVRDVRAAHFEAVRGQMVQASRVTRLAVVDALFHFGCCVVDNNHLLKDLSRSKRAKGSDLYPSTNDNGYKGGFGSSLACSSFFFH